MGSSTEYCGYSTLSWLPMDVLCRNKMITEVYLFNILSWACYFLINIPATGMEIMQSWTSSLRLIVQVSKGWKCLWRQYAALMKISHQFLLWLEPIRNWIKMTELNVKNVCINCSCWEDGVNNFLMMYLTPIGL